MSPFDFVLEPLVEAPPEGSGGAAVLAVGGGAPILLEEVDEAVRTAPERDAPDRRSEKKQPEVPLSGPLQCTLRRRSRIHCAW